MVIFHSYVSLPEGRFSRHLGMFYRDFSNTAADAMRQNQAATLEAASHTAPVVMGQADFS